MWSPVSNGRQKVHHSPGIKTIYQIVVLNSDLWNPLGAKNSFTVHILVYTDIFTKFDTTNSNAYMYTKVIFSTLKKTEQQNYVETRFFFALTLMELKETALGIKFQLTASLEALNSMYFFPLVTGSMNKILPS